MKNTGIIFILMALALGVAAQKPKPKRKNAPSKSAQTKAVSPTPFGSGKEEYEKAVAVAIPAERVASLQKFVENFPDSENKISALELIVSARAEIADEKLRLSETESGLELFKLAVSDAPTPLSDKLFTEVILQIPTNLFFRGERAAAYDIAKMIEAKIEGNVNQTLGLATFYLGIENAAEAKHLARKALELAPETPAAFQTLGLANRLDFRLDDAADAYSRALELDGGSIVSKRSLAEMKRAVGKPGEAAALYREILAANETDAAARTGLILSLFDDGKLSEAETLRAKSLDENPNNLPLLVGAAYFYAARGSGSKAIELAEKALAIEPRYTWAHIALARGLVLNNQPLEAERILLAARQYGNFPTLDYELAVARLKAGFYREAAETLRDNFGVKNGIIETKLGGRVAAEANSFTELLAAERRASIFEPAAADVAEDAERLKNLLDFSGKLDAAAIDETDISRAADEFVKGDDKMKLHRQIYAANRLLSKRTAAAKALELTKAAVGGVNAALDVPNPAAAVLADELYESRKLAVTRNQLIVVPDVPRETLSKILRGRIEETIGWALFQQEKPDEAVVRFKRALSVLPEKSAWWRDSQWRLGSALQTGKKDEEALDAYIKSFTSGAPDAAKRIVIEALYQKVNGNLEGLDEKIGAKPASIAAAFPIQEEPNETVEKTDARNQNEQSEAVAPPTSETKVETPAVESAEVQTLPTPKTEETPTVEETPTPELSEKEIEQKAVESKTAAPPEINTNDLMIEPKAAPPETATPVKPPEAQTPEESPESVQLSAEKKSEPPQKSIFDPIIISVPETIVEKKPKSESLKPPVNAAPNENSETGKTASDAAATDDSANAEKETRPRFVTPKKIDEPVAPCKITVSQEKISVLGGGGSLSVLVGFKDGGDAKKITATSSSPQDVEITFEPQIGADSSRAFFVIKSISENRGVFAVAFESLCGRKEITVKVR